MQNTVVLFWFSCSIKVLIKYQLIFSLRFFDRSAGCYFLYQNLCLSVFHFVQYVVSLVECMPYLVFLLFWLVCSGLWFNHGAVQFINLLLRFWILFVCLCIGPTTLVIYLFWIYARTVSIFGINLDHLFFFFKFSFLNKFMLWWCMYYFLIDFNFLNWFHIFVNWILISIWNFFSQISSPISVIVFLSINFLRQWYALYAVYVCFVHFPIFGIWL